MRVLYDHQIFSYQAFGGASRYFAELMNAWHARGAPEFDLGVARSPNEYLAHAPYWHGKRGGRAGVPAFLARYARNELATLALSRRRPHDIVHATFYDPAVLRARRGAKLVVTVLDMIPERFPDMFEVTGLYGRFVTKRWIAGKRELCARADAILAISEHTKNDIVELYGIDPARIAVTHLGNRLTSDSASPPAGLPERYVLFVGTRGGYKNFDLLLEARPELPIVCIGGGALTDIETAKIKKLGATVMQRNVNDRELAACYANAAAFVFPSLYEGFGIPILEAFACGCPALVANASCFPEIAGDAALYFDPSNAASLRSALDDVLASFAHADALRARGRAREKQFSWDTTARETLAAYKRAVA